MATLLSPFSPSPLAKVSQIIDSTSSPSFSLFPLGRQNACSRKADHHHHHRIRTSKFGNFLELTPESVPEFLDFDLPWFHPSDRIRYDVIIIGTGPAGLRLAEQVSSRHSVKVCCVDPSPLSTWPNNYGVWVDEFEDIGLVDCLDKTWPMTCVFINDHKTKYLDRPYGRVSRNILKTKLLENCVSNGVKFHKAKVWHVNHQEFESSIVCDDGNEIKASLIVDASGFASSFVEYDKPRNHGYQIAHGILAEVESHPFDLDKMVLMDWRDCDEWLFVRKDENELGPYSEWNITGTYRGTWKFLDSTNSSSRFRDFRKSNGNSITELVSTPTKINGVHYVQGVIIFHDVFDNEHNVGGAQIRVEGVYIWPFRQLRMVAHSGKQGELSQEDDYILSNPYHLLGVFSSQVFQESPREKIWRRKNSPIYEMEKHCNIEIAAQISRVSSTQHEGDHDRYHIEGLMESPAVDDDGDCFSPLLLNATSVNIEVYYNKAVNYTLMVTFVSFLQVLLLIRQMEHSNTQSGAAKVSILMIGQQAIMDAYLCLLHLTAGILVESLFNAFATAAFFKFVVFSIFEMRYLLAIWKASRPMNNGEGWETMRRELSVLYSRFYGILLGGILVMYEFHNFLRPILLLMYSFWIPQIITNVVRDSRKFLHPHYILGISVTRLAIPLYIFGCPHNFMRIEPDKNWCICLCVFIGLQASILLLQHYLGSRWFIPRQILPEKYSYYRRFDQGTYHTTDCVICMTAIDLMQRSNDCMVTPCDHFFHSGCLQRWMDIKMECPTCRRPLPPA